MKLFVGNLSYDTSTQELRDALADHEPILDIHRPTDRETGQPRGFAFITFSSPEEGAKAMETINKLKLGGRELRADEAVDNSRDSFQAPPPRPRRPTMNVEVDRVDDRPLGPDGRRIRYKGI